MIEKSTSRIEFYSSQRQKEDKETFWVYYVTRPLSFLVTPIFLKLSLSANQVSCLGIIIGIIAAILVTTGIYWQVLTGAILMQIWLILDSVDGNIARYKKTFTLFGKFLEEINGTIMSVLFFSSVGFAASRMPGFLPQFVEIPYYMFSILGLIASFSIIFRHLISRHFEVIYYKDQEFKNESLFRSGFISTIYRAAIKFLGIYSLAQPLLLLAVIFNLLGLYIIIYFPMQVTAMFVNIGFVIIKAKNNQNNY